MSRISVDVDVDDVLEEIDTRALVAEVNRRGTDALAALGLTENDVERLKQAVKADDGRRAVDILRPLFFKPDLEKLRAHFDALPRDIATRRPLIP